MLVCVRMDSLLCQRIFLLSGDFPLAERDCSLQGPAFLKASIWYADNNGLSSGLALKSHKKKRCELAPHIYLSGQAASFSLSISRCVCFPPVRDLFTFKRLIFLLDVENLALFFWGKQSEKQQDLKIKDT